MSNQKESVFSVLSRIDVNKDVQAKNGLKYLSWASAVKHLLNHYPDSTWNHTFFNGLPYLQTESGCFVEVTVTVMGISRTQLHPVFDYRNQAIKNPNAMDINKSIQRALAKCIALHGLGLYIFDGEDLPEKEPVLLATNEQKNKLKILLGADEYSAHKEFIETKLTQEQADLRLKQLESKNA